MTKLNAYAARSCPTRTHFDVVRPVTPAAPDTLQRMLIDAGIEHEKAVFDALSRAFPNAVMIDASVDAVIRETLTREAISNQAPLICGGRFTDDVRVGEPDILVKTIQDGHVGYAPVEIKTHEMLTTTPSGARIVQQPLNELAWPADEPRPYGRQSGATRRTLIQLAHYQALLASLGQRVAGEPWVGMIGTDLTVVWFCIEDPIGRHDDTAGQIHNPVSVNEIYTLEFAYRQAIAADAATDVDAATGSRLAPPVSNPECPHCPWRQHCNRLWEERDDVSLLPRVDRHVWTALHAAGLDTIPALATYDTRHALAGFTKDTLQGLSDQARARIGTDPVYRRRDVAAVHVPRADIEIDVDMENVEDGAYLWGLYLTDNTNSGLFTGGYTAVYDWDRDANAASRRVFVGMWEQLTLLRDMARANGMTFAAYCWSQQAENQWLKRGATAHGLSDEVDAFIASYEWVDLYEVVRRQLITGRSNGLKTFAPLTGFHWRDSQAGGEQAIVWWQQATDPNQPQSEQERMRTRLLTYNEDDVRATFHVRNWLYANRDSLPSIAHAKP